MPRCFLAIEVPAEVRDHLTRVQTALRPRLPGASFPRPQNLHVTLKFLGNVGDREITELCASMRRVRIPGEMTLRTTALECFPARRPARVVVARLGGSEGQTASLQAAIEQRCRKLGFEKETRKYRPHVTLARPRAAIALANTEAVSHALAPHWPGPIFVVREFALFESHLHPEGSKYLKLYSFEFAER